MKSVESLITTYHNLDINKILNGRTPVQSAINYGQKDIIKFLLSHNPNTKSILFHDIFYDHPDLLTVVLENAKNIDFNEEYRDGTILAYAIYNQRFDIVNILLKHISDSTQKPSDTLIIDINFAQYINYKLYDSCPHQSSDLALRLLSSSYSQSLNKITVYNMYSKILENEVLVKILHAVSLNNNLYIYLVDKIQDYNPTVPSGVQAYVGRKSIREGYKIACGIKNAHNKIEGIIHTNKFMDSLVHEFTHAVMDQIFDNDIEPYNDTKNFCKYYKISDQILDTTLTHDTMLKHEHELKLDRNFSNAQNCKFVSPVDIYIFEKFIEINQCFINSIYDNPCIEYGLQLLFDIINFYPDEKWLKEIIVRLPQIIASGCYDNEKVQEIYAPITQYWQEVIDPAIDKYISTHDKSTSCHAYSLINEFDVLFQ